MTSSENELLRVTSLLDGLLEVLERSFCRRHRDHELGRFLLNHSDVIQNSLVVGTKVKCLVDVSAHFCDWWKASSHTF